MGPDFFPNFFRFFSETFPIFFRIFSEAFSQKIGLPEISKPMQKVTCHFRRGELAKQVRFVPRPVKPRVFTGAQQYPKITLAQNFCDLAFFALGACAGIVLCKFLSFRGYRGVPEKMESGKNGTSETFGGIWASGISMLPGENGTFAKFGPHIRCARARA